MPKDSYKDFLQDIHFLNLIIGLVSGDGDGGMYMCFVCGVTESYTWRPQNNFRKPVHSFQSGSWNCSQDVRLRQPKLLSLNILPAFVEYFSFISYFGSL